MEYQRVQWVGRPAGSTGQHVEVPDFPRPVFQARNLLLELFDLSVLACDCCVATPPELITLLVQRILFRPELLHAGLERLVFMFYSLVFPL